MEEVKKCSIEGCESPARAKGLCRKHHTRLLRHGDASVRLTPEGCDPSRTCSVDGCDRPLLAKGLCGSHYARQSKGMALDIPFRGIVPDAKCSVDGCGSPVTAKGLCLKHYTRARRHGDPVAKLRPEGRQRCSIEDCGQNAYSGGLCKKHARRKAATGNPRVATIHRDPTRICIVEGCGAPYSANGMCSIHYQRYLRHGDLKEIINPKQVPAGVPKQSLEDAFNWNSNECLHWKFQRKDGYARISRHWYGSQNVCRIICERMHGPAPSPKHEASHTCGNGHDGCINPVHLIWETPPENGARKKTHKRMHNGRGSGHFKAKLNEDQVRKIRGLLPTMKQTEIAKMFGLNNETIGAIARGRSWGWLDEGADMSRVHEGRGSKHYRAILTEMDVLKIRSMLPTGMLQKDIAAHFGVSSKLISAIATGRKWAWLK